MTDHKIPYVSGYRKRSDEVVWRFIRNGHSCKLPEGLKEPWYTPAYQTALKASGMAESAILRVMQGMPHSLARSVLDYRRAPGFLDQSAERRRAFCVGADVLSFRIGWLDRRKLSSTIMDRLKQQLAEEPKAVGALNAVFGFSPSVSCSPNMPRLSSRASRPANVTVRWTEADLVKFCAQVPVGSRKRAALFVLLHVGRQPKAAVCKMHPEFERELQHMTRQEFASLLSHSSRQRLDALCKALSLPKPTVHALADLNATRTADILCPE